jgi:carbohydrate-selective porin OprB
LSFNQDFAKEAGGDFGYVQIQVDAGTWQTVATLDASTSGGYETDISSYLPSPNSEFRIRFRYVANDNLYWKVDEFELSGGNP